MLELGNQKIKAKSGFREKTGKDYFSKFNFEHISVDLNGQDGALVKDLRNLQDFIELKDYFDVITNSGTTEHVEPFESQFQCFEILHYVSKRNSVTIHLVPDVEELEKNNSWKDHCHVYYSLEFFQVLANACGYQIIENKIIDGLRAVSYIKTSDFKFSIEKQLFFKNLTWID